MNKPVCIIEAPTLSRSGYGDMSNKFALSMINHPKFETKIVPTRWGACPSKFSENDGLTANEKIIFDHLLRQPLSKQPELFIKVGLPTEMRKVGKYNILITAGIETNLPSPQFVESMNIADLNIVISSFLKDVFLKAKYQKQYNDGSGRSEEVSVNKPVEVCFIGVDDGVFKQINSTSNEINLAMQKIKEDFCFLFVGMWTHSNGLYSDRKDVGMLIKTFLKAFRGVKNKPALILKTSGATTSVMDRNECLAKIKAIKNEVGGDDLPNVYLLHGDFTQEQMNEIYNHEKVKAHINFSHGEGFGIPLLEASFSGKPIITTDWSGHLDFLDKDTAVLLQGDVRPIQPESVNEWLVKDSQWFYVNYEKAEERIQNIPHVYEKLAAKGLKAMEKNRELFNTRKMQELVHSIVNKYVPEFAVEQSIILPKLKKIELPKLAKVE